MWHKASEELPEMGQLVIIKDIYKSYVIRLYHPGIKHTIEFWTEFPVNGWKQARNFKETIRENLVLASNASVYIVNEDFFFSKCNNEISCAYNLYTHYHYLPLINE